MSMLAKELGIEQQFTEGRTQDQWVEWMIEESKKKDPNFPSVARNEKEQCI